jgi:hypothetical protein
MSTKIYEAYRIVEGVDPLNVLWTFKATGRKNAKRRLAEMYRTILEGRSDAEAQRQATIDELFAAWLREQRSNEDPLTLSSGVASYTTWRETVCPPELRVRSNTKCAVTQAEILEKIGKTDGPLTAFDVDRWILKNYGDQLTSSLRNPWNFDAHIAVRRFDERFYLIPYAENNQFIGNTLDFLKKSPLLEDFAYWNNTDRPKKVTKAAWEERETIWECLIEPPRFSEFLTLEVVSYSAWHDITPVLEVCRTKG